MTLILILIFLLFPLIHSQPKPPSPPPSSACNGVYISYTYAAGKVLPPILKSDPARQAYRFESSFEILNNDFEQLKSWRVFVGFQHGEYLVSAANAILADGSSFPGSVGNGSVFAGYPNPDLKSGIETAGDLAQMSARVDLLGTQFGVAPPDPPMPKNISLVIDGWLCPKPTLRGRSFMSVCCTRDPKFESNTTLDKIKFLPRQNGDLTISYDVTRTYESNYWGQVTIENHNPLSRLDNWELNWDWMEDEFIYAMKGAVPSLIDASDCIFGKQGQYYQKLDFANALSCKRRPTIVDLPLSATNNTELGMVPYCCRNGTILPPAMDPNKAKSSFQIVFKMPPNLNRSHLAPPQNWAIKGRLNPDYICGPPVRVEPSHFLNPNGLSSNLTVVATWQVVCNITKENLKPKCCVSFSAFYNDSIIPCRTCACGCNERVARKTCSTTAPAMLLPPQGLLVPFENRSALAKTWVTIHHLPNPSPAPCGDNCGISINWHLFTDYVGGWSARITIFNWEESPYVDWFTAVQLKRTVAGFEEVYSFNGSVMEGVKDTLFMQGLPGLNYLVGMANESNPSRKNLNLKVPGKQQTVISFTKKLTPGVNVTGGDGFPTRVLFNGEECSLPTALPTSSSTCVRIGATSYVVFIIVFGVVMLSQF